MQILTNLLAASIILTAGTLAQAQGSMPAEALGNNMGAMEANLHTFDGIVYAPVTDCKSYTAYAAPTSRAASRRKVVRVRLSSFRDDQEFDVPANDSIFVTDGNRGVLTNTMAVVDGPVGVQCTAWEDKNAKKQIGDAVRLGKTVDLVANVEEVTVVRSLRCAFS